MRWLQLEANPEILNKYARELAMRDERLEFEDVPSLERDVIVAIIGEKFNNTRAFLIVAPIQVLDTIINIPIPKDEAQPIFIKQFIDNSCGAIALFHVLTNIGGVNSPFISKLTELPDAESRGTWLETGTELHDLHRKYASAGSTDTPDLGDETDLHFIALVEWQGKSVLFDGRKDSPVKLEQSGDFIDSVLNYVSSLASHNESLSISLIALTCE